VFHNTIRADRTTIVPSITSTTRSAEQLGGKSPIMDHGGMDMGSMGSMGSSTGFYATNSSLARSYWYIIAGVLAFTFILRIVDLVQTKIRSVLIFTILKLSLTHILDTTILTSCASRLRLARSRSIQNPSRPQKFLMQSYATVTAICREMSAPEIHFRNRWVSWLSPPPLGRSLLLAAYWAVIVYMLCWESIISDAYYWERIGYRAAWVSVTQIPFVYLLAAKSSIVGFLAGSSHERLNWLHRWVSRTLLLTVTVHGGFFFTEWVRSGDIGDQTFVAFELSIMPMVRYGIGAWFVLLWTFLSSLTPIRRWSYEIFVLQHLAAAAVFLWLIYVHVPAYAQYNVWFAIAAVSFDKVFLFCWSLRENVQFRLASRPKDLKPKMIGHHAELRALDDETSEVVVKDVSMKWKAGQHIYLRVPALGPTESHPFTIANVCNKNSHVVTNEIQLVIQAQSGFTRRLHRKAKMAPEGSKLGMTAIVTGPFGCPPAWNSFETLVLISAATGTSFTLPILESMLSNKENSCTSRIDFLMIVRRWCGTKAYLTRLKKAVTKANAAGIELNISVSITGELDTELADLNERAGSGPKAEGCQCNVDAITSLPSSSTSSATGSVLEGKDGSDSALITSEKEVKSCCCGTGKDAITFTCGRPDIADFIREPVEASGGETSVAVCGGNGLVAMVRNMVARLSDERAVHKGTGAQGIHLHAEHYCF
jgi:hypothetical protein